MPKKVIDHELIPFCILYLSFNSTTLVPRKEKRAQILMLSGIRRKRKKEDTI